MGDICYVGHNEAKSDGWAGGGPHIASFFCISDVGTNLLVSVLCLELSKSVVLLEGRPGDVSEVDQCGPLPGSLRS